MARDVQFGRNAVAGSSLWDGLRGASTKDRLPYGREAGLLIKPENYTVAKPGTICGRSAGAGDMVHIAESL